MLCQHAPLLTADGLTPPCFFPRGASDQGVCDLVGNVHELTRSGVVTSYSIYMSNGDLVSARSILSDHQRRIIRRLSLNYLTMAHRPA